MSPTSSRDLRLSRQVYRLRVLGLGLGLLSVAAVFQDHRASPWAWGVPSANRRLSIEVVALPSGVRVSVADSGPGVEAAIAPTLFEPFHSTKKSGMGLGLSICRTLIEAHGGRIGTAPRPGGGAVFFFELPAAPEPA